jgi:hypothetical protein
MEPVLKVRPHSQDGRRDFIFFFQQRKSSFVAKTLRIDSEVGLSSFGLLAHTCPKCDRNSRIGHSASLYVGKSKSHAPRHTLGKCGRNRRRFCEVRDN